MTNAANNKSFENITQFKGLGMTINLKDIHDKIKKTLSKVFGPWADEVTNWRELHNEELLTLNS
jgi:hypothetical protein